MATSSRTPSRFLEGPMFKRGRVAKGWKYRWFVLDRHVGLLSYYTSKDDVRRGLRRGCIQLKLALVGMEDECGLSIHVANRTCLLKAQNFQERERWVHALNSCIRRLHQPPRHLKLTLPDIRKGVTLDQRMAETEGYYQLLHKQVQSVLQSLNTTEEASQIRKTSKSMLEALRQCLDTMMNVQMRGDSKQLATIPEGAGEEGNQMEEEALGRETAYSSDSESSDASSLDFESDEYFDVDSELLLDGSMTGDVVPSVDLPLDNPLDVEEDELFHDTDDNTSSIRTHRSVIFHILSQLRLGMDLTRISLPAFMLERRSLLEMVAEFLAHPDLFTNAADLQDPRQRMVAMLRFYLSSFHAGRSSEVAKKPYNPILGETFQCYWDIPNARRIPPSENTKRLLESGPVSFANYNSVAYISEQVSHHPPITAFYAECPSKRMFMNGSILTKSGLLGLSIGVQNIGSLNCHLLDYGEEYVMTIPNIYVRSLLTIPWLEMGGVCTITCAQSQCTANVEFHCKPFYGGKKHWITAEVHHVTDKKPFLRVEGEWNGVMYSKHPNMEVFLDTVNTPTIPKKLRRLSAQGPGESRRRWHHVTEALKKQDMEAASDAKHMIEEQQRIDTRERNRLGIEWKQKLFHAEGQAWVYNNPLSKRLKELDTCQQQ